MPQQLRGETSALKRYATIIGALWLAAAAPLLSDETDENFGMFQTHLEFLGYTCQTKPGESGPRLSCKTKESVPDMHIQRKGAGYLITFYRIATDEGRKNEKGMLSLVNRLNSDAMLARFYRDEAGDLIMEAYYPGSYSKDSFTSFVSAFHDDWKRLTQKFEDELGKLVNL